MSTFDKIIDKENIYKAYKQTRKGNSKFDARAILFHSNESENLKSLRENLINETYEFDGYIKFYVYEPKERLIHAPYYKDKIVQIAINNILKKTYYPSFIYDSYSCIDNKGTHSCAKRIQKFSKYAEWKYNNPIVIKIDIRKFFYSIDRQIFKEILTKKIKCNKTLKLLYKITDSANVIDKLGLPLGNTLSQIGSNIYMNEVDQYIKRNLGIKCYVRYADDMVLIVNGKEEAKRILKLITTFLKNQLKLDTNINKTKIFPLSQGINTVGFKIYPTHMLLRDRSKKKIKKRLRSIKHLIPEGKLAKEKAEQMLNSWKGHADFADDYNFTQNLLKKFDFIYLEKNIMKIKEMNL